MATDLQAGSGISAGGHARGWLAIVGVLALALGAVGLYMTLAFMVVSLVWYGALLIVAGLVQSIEAVVAPTARRGRISRGLRLALGLLYVAAGLYALFQPSGAGLALTLVLGILLVASGAVRAAWMLAQEGRRSRALGILLAAVSVALGVSLIGQWPLSGLWAIGLFVSVDLIAYGLSWAWAAYMTGRG